MLFGITLLSSPSQLWFESGSINTLLTSNVLGIAAEQIRGSCSLL